MKNQIVKAANFNETGPDYVGIDFDLIQAQKQERLRLFKIAYKTHMSKIDMDIVTKFKNDPKYKSFIDFLYNTNTTNALYHNTDHMIGVAAILYNMDLQDEYFEDLVMAGLFHDYFYDTALKTDHDKIQNTLYHLERDIPLTNVTKTLIKYTEYPYISVEAEHGYLCKYIDFIRSADMIYSTVFCTYDVLSGLYIELKDTMKFDSFKDFLLRNIDFISNTSFGPEYFKKLNARHLHTAISYHLELIKEQNDRI